MFLHACKLSLQRSPAARAGPASSVARFAPTGAVAQPKCNPSLPSAIAGPSPGHGSTSSSRAQASGPPSQGSGPQEFPSSSCLFRTTTGALMMRLSMNGQLVHCGWAAAGDFPDSPQGDWAVAGAYRELILRVRNILREDPKAAIPEARVDDAGNRVAPWQPGDGTLRPEVVQRLRAAVTLRGAAPGGTLGGPRTTNPDLPRGSGLSRRTVKATSAPADTTAKPRPGSLYMSLSVDGRMVQCGRAAMGDFPDCPEDGWAVALQYKEFIRGVINQLKADPGAEVEVAQVNLLAGGRRLKDWQPGDQSVRLAVLRAIRNVLGQR